MRKAKQAGASGVLDESEWKFGDRLSAAELAACHAHEYGREIAKRSRYVMTQLKILWRANELPEKHQRRGPDLSGATIFSRPRRTRKVKRHRERIAGDEAASKLWSFGIPEETLGQRGFEARNWYGLPESIRETAVRAIRERLKWEEYTPRTSALLRTIRELDPSGNGRADGFLHRQEVHFLRQLLDAGFRGANIELGFFAIDWNSDLGELKNQIFAWLKEQREHRSNVSPVAQRRPSRGQLRDQLRWLGALRVKEHYPPCHLTHGNEPKLIVPAPYKWKPDLWDAAKKAKKILDDRIGEIMQPSVAGS